MKVAKTYRAKRCPRCRQMLPAAAFRLNPKMRSGLSSWCRPCMAVRNREWRDANPEYVAAANAARRKAPTPKNCSACGVEYSAKHPHSHRCPDCQSEHRRKR
jgi:predicted Zn-ribbon and HTH transcriptional regulator